MQAALALEKNVNQALLDLHGVAETKGDAHVSINHLDRNSRDLSPQQCTKPYFVVLALVYDKYNYSLKS